MWQEMSYGKSSWKLHFEHQTRSFMRRTIQRIVTVETTTTMKISWEADRNPSQPKNDPAADELAAREILPESTPPGPTVIETKEANLPETQIIRNPPAEGLPDDLNTYPLKKGNEKS
jgi:hypothetical protein